MMKSPFERQLKQKNHSAVYLTHRGVFFGLIEPVIGFDFNLFLLVKGA